MATSWRNKKNYPLGVGTLNTTITSGGLTIVLDAGQGANFPSATFTISIDEEIILIDSRSTDTLTVNASGRGYDGSTAAAHAAGTSIANYQIVKDFTDIETAINAIENGTVTLSSVALPDLSTDPIGKLKHGASADFYWGYDGSLDFLGLHEGVGGKVMMIVNSLVSAQGAPFTFAFGNDWAAWEADNPGFTYPDNLNNWHFYSSSSTVAVMEIESRGETVLSIESDSDGSGTNSAYVLFQTGQTNRWSIGNKASDSNAFVIGLGPNFGTPYVHIKAADALATFTGSIDAKDFYNDDATPTLTGYLSATVGGVVVAPNKNIASLAAAGNLSARLHLNDINGTADRRIMEITMDGETSSWVRRTDVGFATTMLSFAHADSAATFAALLMTKQGLASDSVKVGGTAYYSTTAVGNVGAGEDDLMSHSVPAATLGTNGDSLWFEMVFTTAANANNKTIKVKFGATTLWDSGAVAANDQRVIVSGRIVRTGAATQIAYVNVSTSGGFTATAVTSAPAETLANAITLKATGEATSDNDIQQTFMIVGWDPSNT